MDQGVRSALNKYNVKIGIQEPTEKNTYANKISLALAVVVAASLVFSVCVKYEFLGADKAWSKITEIHVGEETVGSLIEGIGEEISSVFSKNNTNTTAPVNSNGESASIEP